MTFDIALVIVAAVLVVTLWMTRKRTSDETFDRPFSNDERFAYWEKRIEREIGKRSEEYLKLCADGKDGKAWILDGLIGIEGAKINPNKFVWEQSQVLIVYKRPVLRLAR